MKGQKLMAHLAGFITRYHKIIPVIALVLFILSLIAMGNIQTRTQLKDMLPMEYPQVASFDRITEKFSGGSSLLIAFEGKDKEKMAAAAEAFAGKLEANGQAMQLIHAIDLKVDRDFITQWGLILQKEKDLADTRASFANLNLVPFVTSLNDSFEKIYTGEEAEEQIETGSQENEAVQMLNNLASFFTGLREYLEAPGTEGAAPEARRLAETFVYGDEYTYAPDYSMLLMSIYPNFNLIEMEKIDRLMAEIRATIAAVEGDFPGLAIGYAGDIGMQADENLAMNFDLMVPSILAFILVAAITIFSYRQLRFIIFYLIALVVGIVFNYGLLGITFKEITIITSMMAALLIGMGDDFGIQTITNYSEFMDRGLSPKDALKETFAKAGIGTMLAAATTATAFFVLAATGSKAFAQFGLLAGMGILCCYLAMTFVLPALLVWFSPKDPKPTRLPRINYDFLAGLAGFMSKRKRFTAGVAITLTLVFIVSMFNLGFEYDMMKLEPQQMPAVKTYHKILDKFGLMPISSMVSCDSIEAARQLTEQLEQESSIAEVRSISQFIAPPGEQEARLNEIAKFRRMGPRYQTATLTRQDVQRFIDEIQRLEYNVIEIGDLSIAGLGEDNKIVKKRNEIVREVFGAEAGAPGREVFQRVIARLRAEPQLSAVKLTQLDRHFAPEMDRIVSSMTNITRPITLADLPGNIVNQFMDAERQENLVTAFPKDNVLASREKIQRYNERLGNISTNITGLTTIVAIWQNELINSAGKAALYIFFFMFLIILFTLRNFKASLIATIPLVLGMIWMLGIYPLLGLKLNMINLTMVPLVIGLGINYGVHFVCRYLLEPDIPEVYKTTGKAVTLSALTTMFGFGSLALVGTWAAISSMGMILFVGITTSLLTAIFIEPALLGFLKKNSQSNSSTDQILGGNINAE